MNAPRARWMLARVSARSLARWLTLAALLACALPARALCIGSCSCSVLVTNVVFSPYQPLAGTNVDSTGSVRLTCGGLVSLLIPATLSLSKGASTSYVDRRLMAGSAALTYNLYTSSSYATVIGDGSGGSTTMPGGVLIDVLGVVTPQVWTIYGRIPGGQRTAIPGAYSDTVVLTVTYQ